MKKIYKWIMIFFVVLLCIGCDSKEELSADNITGTVENTLTEELDNDGISGEEKKPEEVSKSVDEKAECYINDYINLSNDTEVEGYEWMQYDNEQVLHVKIQYKELTVNNYRHKEDYFLFIVQEEKVSQILLVDYEDKGIHVRLDEGTECINNHILGEGCSFDAHFEDVTFDNQEDLVISVGNSRHAEYYCVYVYEDGEFRYEKTFEHIPSYVVDIDNEVIYGSDTDGMGLYFDTTYEYKNGEFLLIEKNEYSIKE